jgi:hypothetical protein
MRCRRNPIVAAADVPGLAGMLTEYDELEEGPGPLRMALA